MILDALFGILVAIITVSGLYVYRKRVPPEKVRMVKDYYQDYKGSAVSALNDSVEKLKGAEKLKSTAIAGLQSLRTSNAGQNLDIEELKKELKKEIEEELKHETSLGVSEQKSKSVGEAVEATKNRQEDLKSSASFQDQVEEENTFSQEPQPQREENEDEDSDYLDLDLENIRIDEEDEDEEEDEEEALELDEDVEDDQYSQDEEDWISELSRDIEKGTKDKVDLQRDLKNSEFSVKELEKELEDSYKKLKEFQIR